MNKILVLFHFAPTFQCTEIIVSENKKRCDGSDGKAEDSGLNGPGLYPQSRQENINFWLFYLAFNWLLWSLWDLPLEYAVLFAYTLGNK